MTEFEFSQEEYRQLQVEFWSKFYACCLQYQEALATPLGLLLNPHTHMVCLLKKVRKERHAHVQLHVLNAHIHTTLLYVSVCFMFSA